MLPQTEFHGVSYCCGGDIVYGRLYALALRRVSAGVAFRPNKRRVRVFYVSWGQRVLAVRFGLINDGFGYFISLEGGWPELSPRGGKIVDGRIRVWAFYLPKQTLPYTFPTIQPPSGYSWKCR